MFLSESTSLNRLLNYERQRPASVVVINQYHRQRIRSQLLSYSGKFVSKRQVAAQSIQHNLR